MLSTWKNKKRKTTKFVDAESNNRNERRGLITWNESTRRMEKKIKVSHSKMCKHRYSVKHFRPL
jgi:hypothetical protein